MLILVLEASTASAKAMLYRSGEGIIGLIENKYSSDTGDITTVNPDKMISQIIAVARQLLDGKKMEAVDMVVTCSIWSHSLLMLDADKRPVSDISTWADTTAAVTARRYRQDVDLYTLLYKRTGCPIHSTYTLWKYIHEKENGNVQHTRFIASMPEYLFLKLTGEFAVSKSTTSGGGFLNIHTLDWDELALSLAGIDRSMLPKLVESEYTAPLSEEAARLLGLKDGTPVLVTGADGCMNQVASGAFSENCMTLSIGTSAAMRISTKRPVLADYPSTWCYAGVENAWIAGCATAGAGNCVDWIGKKIIGAKGNITLKELDRGAENVHLKEDMPIFLPFPAGERCPGWDDTKTATMYQLKISHDSNNLYYSVLEGILFNLRQCYDIAIPIVGQPPKYICVSGGIEKSPYWISMAASIFGLPVYVDGAVHASMLGAAYIGLKVGGEISTVKEIKPQLKDCYEPDADKQEFYTNRFQKYLKYYNQNM